MVSIRVERTPAGFRSAASTELAYCPYFRPMIPTAGPGCDCPDSEPDVLQSLSKTAILHTELLKKPLSPNRKAVHVFAKRKPGYTYASKWIPLGMRMICFSDKGILNRRLPAPRKRFALFAIFLQIIMFLISSISFCSMALLFPDLNRITNIP